MHVELALFEGDELLERTVIRVRSEKTTNTFRTFAAHHQLGPVNAELVLDHFSDNIALKRTTLDMPVHESEDWESIDLGGYTLAFWCRLNA